LCDLSGITHLALSVFRRKKRVNIMSSWDRSRYVPWSRLNEVSAEDYETEKERLFHRLNREATKEITSSSDNDFVPPELEQRENSKTNNSTPNHNIHNNTQKKKNAFGFDSSVEYAFTDLLRSAAFGGSIGSITGATFGFMDGMRNVTSDTSTLKHASNAAKGRFLLQGTTRTGATFGAFFGGFHICKYGIRVIADPGDVVEIGAASVLGLGTMMTKPVLRSNLPYAVMLISMDCFSLYMNKYSS